MKNSFPFLCLLALLLTFSAKSFAQNTNIPLQHLKTLQLYEDTLRTLSDSIINGEQDIVRQSYCYAFVRKLVQTLKTPQSFEYNFDSLRAISIIRSPDNKFKMFTWNVPRTNGTFRYFGAIQMNEEKKLVLYPLFDYSPLIRNEEDTICKSDSWYGCMYYNIVPKTVGAKTYYTLFGWKGYNTREVKKVMDVLTFGADKKPLFGASAIIQVKQDGKLKYVRRFVISFNKYANVSLNYSAESNQIIFDHLITKATMNGKAEMPGKQRGFDYLPDGTYEAFEWKENKWKYVEQLQNVQYENAPVPVPVFKK
jgi:hypothetical protein